jgi:hypothetical protein
MVSDPAVAEQVNIVYVSVYLSFLSLLRYDAAYIDDRRYGLEVYLRGLLRLPGLIDNCPSLRNFLNITALASEDAYALERDAFDAVKHEYTYIYDPEPDEGELWMPVNRDRFGGGQLSSSSSRLNGFSAGPAVPATKEATHKLMGIRSSPIAVANATQGGGGVQSPPTNGLVGSQSSSNMPNSVSLRNSSLGMTDTFAGINTKLDSDDSELDSDDDKEYMKAGQSTRRDDNAKTNSKFSSVYIDGRDRSGSIGSAHNFGTGSGSPPLGTSPSLRSFLTNGNADSVKPEDGDQIFSPDDKEDDTPADFEDPNDVWALSISSAVNAGVLPQGLPPALTSMQITSDLAVAVVSDGFPPTPGTA